MMPRLSLVFWLVFALAMAVYLTMILWTLPAISAATGGLMAFDMRPGGYTLDETRAFLAALGPEGAEFYTSVQHRLDLFYPPLLAASLFLAIALLAPARIGRWRWLLAAVALPAGAFDWLENAAVGNLLSLGPLGITEADVATASRWSVLKATASTLAMTVLLVLLVLWGWKKWRGRRAA